MKNLLARLRGPGIVGFNDWTKETPVGKLKDKMQVKRNSRSGLFKVILKISNSLNLLKGLPIPDFNNQYDPTIL